MTERDKWRKAEEIVCTCAGGKTPTENPCGGDKIGTCCIVNGGACQYLEMSIRFESSHCNCLSSPGDTGNCPVHNPSGGGKGGDGEAPREDTHTLPSSAPAPETPEGSKKDIVVAVSGPMGGVGKTVTPEGVKCPVCDGSGYEMVMEHDDDRSYPVPNGPCGKCNGTGKVPSSDVKDMCKRCKGSGLDATAPNVTCLRCKGTGKEPLLQLVHIEKAIAEYMISNRIVELNAGCHITLRDGGHPVSIRVEKGE